MTKREKSALKIMGKAMREIDALGVTIMVKGKYFVPPRKPFALDMLMFAATESHQPEKKP